MNALEIIRAVEAHGGQLSLDAGELRVRAESPLPADLLEALSEQKPSVMVALGAPLDATVGDIVKEIRPYLSPALKKLPDDRLLALVNWNVITAWNTAVMRASERSASTRRGVR